jgi:hypothetical protein
MVSTITILAVSVLSWFLVWKMIRPRRPEICGLDDWEAKRHHIDVEAFRSLFELEQEQYLRRSLAPPAFRRFQRQRLGLALRALDLVERNTLMLLKLGQRARANPALAQEADDLIHGALRLRIYLLFVRPCLWLKWLFPAWAWSVPALGMQYEELLRYVSRAEQQWTLKRPVMAN